MTRLLPALLMLLFLAVPVGAAERVALVVGNAEYGSLPDPVHAKADAADMAEKLAGLGFEVTLWTNLERRDLRAAMLEFARASADARVAVLYYSGHVLRFDDRNYLLPIDFVLERGTVETALVFDGFELGRLADSLEDGRRSSLVMIEGCASRDVEQLRDQALGPKAIVQRGLARLDAPLGVMVGFCDQPDARNEHAVKGRNSAFTAAVLDHLGSPGIEIGTTARMVTAGVFESTGGVQVPWWSSGLPGNVYLAGQPEPIPHKTKP